MEKEPKINANEEPQKFWEVPSKYMKAELHSRDIEGIARAMKRFYESRTPETQKWLDEIRDSKRAYEIFYVLEPLDRNVLRWDVNYRLNLNSADDKKQEEMKDIIEKEKKESAKLIKEYLERQYSV